LEPAQKNGKPAVDAMTVKVAIFMALGVVEPQALWRISAG
jgi:hypothetical protein